MSETLKADVQRQHAEQQLFGARRALAQLLEIYEKGQWGLYYKEDTFAHAVRAARLAVDHWTDVVSNCEDGDRPD